MEIQKKGDDKMPEETTPPEQGGDNVPKEGTEGSTEDVEQGTETPSLLEASKTVADRLEKGVKGAMEFLQRMEKVAAQNMLGGSSNAGQAPPEKKELTPEEYTEKVIAGETPEK